MSGQPPSTAPYTPQGRRALLDECFRLLSAIEETGPSGPDYGSNLARISDLWDAYVDQTPTVAVSRCPFTREPFQPALDVLGLDGLFWKFDAAARRSEPMRGSVFAFTGAVRLAEPVEPAPFLCRPGPEAPFVVPRMLARDEIRAVLSTVPIGPHTGYAIVYYCAQPVMDLERFNTWGLDYYELEVDEGVYGWNSSSPVLQDYDFDLAPWIERGKLLWIAPGDGLLEPREGMDGCPYLGLPGRRLPLCIQDGEVWTASLWDAARPEEQPVTGEAADSAPAPAVRDSAREPATPGPKFCRHCGSKLPGGGAFCPGCGKPIGG